jgi:hypothetical protein
MNIRPIFPDAFYAAWLNCVHQIDDAAFRARWEDPSANPYTVYAKGLIAEVGRTLGYQTYIEYHHLDVVFFEENDARHFASGTYARYLAAAVEHENNLGMTAQEMNKLQRTNTPLRVLITYIRNGWDDALPYLADYVRIIRWGDWADDAATVRRQLVIFGNPHERPFGWRGYLYCANGFKQL